MTTAPGRRLRVAPIVEGHGEAAAIRGLLERIGHELIGAEYVEVLQPVREKRDRLIENKDGALEKAVDFSARRLTEAGRRAEMTAAILILVDADKEDADAIEAKLRTCAQRVRADYNTICVAAVKEYETWFVAAAESLAGYLDLTGEEVPSDPEGQRCGKAWIERRIKRRKYSETVDQPKMTARIDLRVCRERCPSFDKLCRELESAMRFENESP